MVQTISDGGFPKLPKAQQQVTWNIITALLSLLTALATARDEILDAIVSNPQILPFLCRLVTYNSTPSEIFIETLICLTTLTEDNMKVSQLILADQSNCLRTLTKFKEAGDVRAVYACAVLHNMYSTLEWYDGSPGQDGATDAKLVPNLCQVLEKTRQDPKTYLVGGVQVEIVTIALEVLASIATDLQASVSKNDKQEEWDGIEGDTAMDNGDDEDMKHGGNNQDDMDDIEADDAGDEDGEDDDDVDMGDAMEADMDLVTGEGDGMEDDPGIDNLPTLREYMSKAIPHLIRLSNLAPASEEAIVIQSGALSALNNIAWTMSCFDYSESGNAGILKVWAPIAKRIWTKVVTPVLATDTADVSLASLVTSTAWAVARTLQGSTPLVGYEHHKFISLYKASKSLTGDPEKAEQEDPLQGLGVKCIGVLGQLAQDPAPTDLNREVGVFLVTILNAILDTPPADVVEALNQMMDIYGDESHPCVKAVFWKDNFLKHLEAALPKAKTMAKRIEKKGATTELRIRADEAVLNLGRFIQYTKKHPPRA